MFKRRVVAELLTPFYVRLVVETSSPGGEAGSSSRIENYLGFPTCISDQELTTRAYNQAQKFDAEMLIDKCIRLLCDRKPYVVEVENGSRTPARTLLLRPARNIEARH
jgi:thioredoxin reductase (NADPH)